MIEIFDENRFDKFRIVDMQSWLHSHETSVQIPILFYFFSAEFPKILKEKMWGNDSLNFF